MREKEVRELYEAYLQVHQPQEVVEEVEELDEDKNYDRNRQRAAQRAAARNEARKQGKTGNVPGVGYVSSRPERETYRDSAGVERHTSGARMPKKKVEEETDLFDYILEHLVTEGYADTNENALAIMANMSEEWRQSIVEQSNPYGRGTSPTPMKVSPSHSELRDRAREKSNREGVWLPPYIGPSLPQAKNKTVNNTKPA